MSNLLSHNTRLRNAVQCLAKRGASIHYAIINPSLPRPVIYVRNTPALTGLAWHCYAWGVDARGYFERWTALVADCQLKREIRHDRIRP